MLISSLFPSDIPVHRSLSQSLKVSRGSVTTGCLTPFPLNTIILILPEDRYLFASTHLGVFCIYFHRSGFEHDFFFIERNLSIILRIKNWDKSKNCEATPELPSLIGHQPDLHARSSFFNTGSLPLIKHMPTPRKCNIQIN